MLRNIFNYTLIASTIRLSTPLILAALGGLYSERSGVINIALEGMMLAGAFTAAAVTVFTHSSLVGVLAALLAGVLVAALHAVATINYRADQVVSGTAINILFLGVPALLSGALFESTGATRQLSKDEVLPDVGLFNSESFPMLASVFNQKPIVYLALLAVAASVYALYRTPFGLRLRAVGENPEAADTAGVNVARMRYAGVLISGALAALGGAYLSIGQSSQFTRNMTAGRGFIALAALIFGKWHPVGALLACLLFGLAEAVSIRMQGTVNIPNQFILMIPYVLTIVMLAGLIRRADPPKALGVAYAKE
ncbi:MAG TPA: ABC transporter permease [Blastocatellia bacterium]|nr:ABC transporter permease [Blastocatellia bacterium]HMV82691.1 ABC transporter permease [Blastocatellia bacterium]HMX27338.1 ABC transporter permease [Blastocatellia bacterium]HMZ16792.1 ABC transporter permease [Blastocatellia bacterium]HNG30420.1 ABC transporter permease [Blastocatellia bacterium]